MAGFTPRNDVSAERTFAENDRARTGFGATVSGEMDETRHETGLAAILEVAASERGDQLTLLAHFLMYSPATSAWAELACYLSFSDVETECEGCAEEIPPGLTGWTDDLLPGRLVAVCPLCLDGLDPRLRGAQQKIAGIASNASRDAGGQLAEQLAGRVEELERAGGG